MKRKLTVTALLVFIFLLGACSSGYVSENQANPIQIWEQNSNGNYHTMLVVDDATGINYIVVSYIRPSGQSAGIAIVPRYNADGTLYVTGR